MGYISDAAHNAGELDLLERATVKKVGVAEMDMGGYTEEAVLITFKLAEPIILNGKPTSEVAYEVWQDPEGNGPGYMALVEAA